MAQTRLIVRITAAGAAVAAALLLGVRGVAAEPPWGGTTSPDRGEPVPSHVCAPNGTALLTMMRANSADDALQPGIHTCAPRGDSGSQPPLTPVHAQPPPPALQLPPAVTVGVILPISVPALAATVTTLPPVSSELAVPAPAAPAPAAGSAAAPASHPANSTQSAAAVLPPPPLVLRLPTVPGVNAGAAAPAALVGVVAPAMGVTGACILVGLLGSTFLVRRP